MAFLDFYLFFYNFFGLAKLFKKTPSAPTGPKPSRRPSLPRAPSPSWARSAAAARVPLEHALARCLAPSSTAPPSFYTPDPAPSPSPRPRPDPKPPPPEETLPPEPAAAARGARRPDAVRHRPRRPSTPAALPPLAALARPAGAPSRASPEVSRRRPPPSGLKKTRLGFFFEP